MASVKQALALNRRGVPIFPMRPGTKDGFLNALGNHGATTNLIEIYDTFRGANLNIGCWAGDGLVIVEIDSDKGGEEAWHGVLAEIGPVPETFAVRSPSGGVHLYYDAGGEVFGQADLVKGKINIRAAGGYVVGPGSTAEDRRNPGTFRSYEIFVDAPIAKVPDNLRQRLRLREERKGEGTTVVSDLDDKVAIEKAIERLSWTAPAIEGAGGDNHTYQTACAIIDFGLSAEKCFDLMWEHFNPRCVPLWDEGELRKKCENAWQYRQASVGRDNPSEGFSPVPDHLLPTCQQPETVERGQLVSRRASEITPERLEWLWPNRFPLGKCTLLAGHGGLGKTTLLLDLAARVTRGDNWPGDEGKAPRGSIIYLSAEDDAADTLVPRLMAAGADLDKVEIVSAVQREDRAGRRAFNLQADLLSLEYLIEQLGDVRAVIFDPISSYFGRADTYRNTEVRAVLEPVGEMAARHRVTIIGNTHLAKGAAGRATHRVLDSVAMTAHARAVSMVLEDPENKGHRIFVPSKANLGRHTGGLRFSLSEKLVVAAQDIRASYVVWGDRLEEATADSILAASDAKHKGPSAIDDVASWLRDCLRAGPVAANEVLEAGTARGFSKITLRRAQKALNIQHRKEGLSGAWIWALPAVQFPQT